jgi:hypothetical protein
VELRGLKPLASSMSLTCWASQAPREREHRSLCRGWPGLPGEAFVVTTVPTIRRPAGDATSSLPR